MTGAPEPAQAAVAGFDNATAAADWNATLRTFTGFPFHVRPARLSDREALAEFFRHVTAEDIYYRFLTGLPRVDEWRIEAMSRVDEPHTIDFLAFASEHSAEVLASAVLAADAAFETAEVAVCTRSDMKHRGLSWSLLDHVSKYAASLA